MNELRTSVGTYESNLRWHASTLAGQHAYNPYAVRAFQLSSLLAFQPTHLPPANGCRSFRMLELRMLELLTPHTFSCSFIRVLNQNFHVEVKHGRVD